MLLSYIIVENEKVLINMNQLKRVTKYLRMVFDMALVNMTISELFSERIRKTPNKTAIVFENTSYTWMELQQLSNHWMIYFRKQGIHKGTHVGIWSTNTPEWILSFLALVKLGAVSVLIGPQNKRQEIEQLLLYSDVEYLCYGDGFKEVDFQKVIEQIDMQGLPKIKGLLPIGHRIHINEHIAALEQQSGEDQIASENEGVLDKAEAIDKEEVLDEAEAIVKPEDVLSILFTSGTTSGAKGVLVSHIAFVNIALEVKRQMHWNEEDKICMSLPLYHCFGLATGFLAHICAGSCIYLLECSRTLNIMECIDKYSCTILNGVPTTFIAMIRNIRRAEFDLSSLKTGIIGGSSIHPEEYLKICKNIGIERLQMSYGQTEATSSISFTGYDESPEKKSVSVGKAIENLEMQIGSLNSRDRLQNGEEGEILIKGYNVMLGYYHMPEKTKQAVDEDGWLHTGDLGFVDRDGDLHITGRIKEIIIRCGENISPFEIEACIYKYSEIDSVKVIGISEEVTQEEIVACIIPKVGVTIEERELRKYLKSNLADFKVPKYIIQMNQFPISMSGKIRLKELEEQAVKIIKKKNREEQACF
jgi:fatty-acyl-CoA synthase